MVMNKKPAPLVGRIVPIASSVWTTLGVAEATGSVPFNEVEFVRTAADTIQVRARMCEDAAPHVEAVKGVYRIAGRFGIEMPRPDAHSSSSQPSGKQVRVSVDVIFDQFSVQVRALVDAEQYEIAIEELTREEVLANAEQ